MIPPTTEHRLQIGDVVRLKSGGPAMTVTATEADGETKGQVEVTWFPQNSCGAYENEARLDNFHVATLEMVEEEVPQRQQLSAEPSVLVDAIDWSKAEVGCSFERVVNESGALVWKLSGPWATHHICNLEPNRAEIPERVGIIQKLDDLAEKLRKDYPESFADEPRTVQPSPEWPVKRA